MTDDELRRINERRRAQGKPALTKSQAEAATRDRRSYSDDFLLNYDFGATSSSSAPAPAFGPASSSPSCSDSGSSSSSDSGGSCGGGGGGE